MSHAYASILRAGNSTAQELATGVAEKVDALTTLGPSSNNRDGDLSCVPTPASQRIAVKKDGIYRVDYRLTIDNDEAGAQVLQFGVRHDGTNEVPGTHMEFTLASSAVAAQVSGSGIFEAAAEGTLEVWVTSDTTGGVLVSDGVLIVERIG